MFSYITFLCVSFQAVAPHSIERRQHIYSQQTAIWHFIKLYFFLRENNYALEVIFANEPFDQQVVPVSTNNKDCCYIVELLRFAPLWGMKSGFKSKWSFTRFTHSKNYLQMYIFLLKIHNNLELCIRWLDNLPSVLHQTFWLNYPCLGLSIFDPIMGCKTIQIWSFLTQHFFVYWI